MGIGLPSGPSGRPSINSCAFASFAAFSTSSWNKNRWSQISAWFKGREWGQQESRQKVVKMTGARARNPLEERYNMVHVAQEELIVRIWLPHTAALSKSWHMKSLSRPFTINTWKIKTCPHECTLTHVVHRWCSLIARPSPTCAKWEMARMLKKEGTNLRKKTSSVQTGTVLQILNYVLKIAMAQLQVRKKKWWILMNNKVKSICSAYVTFVVFF